MRKSRRWWLVLSLLLTGGLTLWIGADILYPTRADLRAFDAHAVARLETQMWRSYYEHHVIRLFNELAELLQRQYGMPFWRSRVAAYQAARAAVTFQRGHNRSEYLNALPNLVNFYRLVERSGREHFDVNRAAALELEWWIIHRERDDHAPTDLPRALGELQAAIYRQPADDFATHAAARAHAMLLRDDLAAESLSMIDDDWQKIGALLDRSWTDLRTTVSRSPVVRGSQAR